MVHYSYLVDLVQKLRFHLHTTVFCSCSGCGMARHTRLNKTLEEKGPRCSPNTIRLSMSECFGVGVSVFWHPAHPPLMVHYSYLVDLVQKLRFHLHTTVFCSCSGCGMARHTRLNKTLEEKGPRCSPNTIRLSMHINI